MSVNAANSRRTMYDVSWNAFDLGGLDDVKTPYGFKFAPIKIGSMGDVKLDDRFIGLTDDAKVIVVLRETLRATIQKLMPWASQTVNNALVFSPPAGTLMYTYAQALILHPRDQTGLTPATREDIQLVKTVPVRAMEIPRTGMDEDKWEIEFMIYPLRTDFPALTYASMTA